MNFDALHRRLVERMRDWVRNGEFTERGIALQTGISQPHMHNVLKGARALTPAIADQVLKKLHLSALDLFESEELAAYLKRLAAAQLATREIPVLSTRLGPGLKYPAEPSPFERFPIACQDLVSVERPVVARLADDPRMGAMAGAGDLVLLDHSAEGRLAPGPQALWALEVRGEGLVRGVRHGAGRLYLLAADCWDNPARWEAVAIPRGGITELVRARVIPLTRSPRRDQRGV